MQCECANNRDIDKDETQEERAGDIKLLGERINGT